MKAFFLAAIAVIAMAATTVTDALAQDGYRIRPGDTLTIEVLQDPSLDRQVLVTPSGDFSFPPGR